MATILKLAIKNIYPNYQHYTDIDPSVNPYHVELHTQDITCMLNCFKEISQNLAFLGFLLL
jgi:hypothetical protein